MYRRVNSERNRDDHSVVSIQDQQEALQKFAEEERYGIVAEYCDGGENEKASTE